MRRGYGNNFKVAMISFLIVSSIAITIGYASFSQILSINGEATVLKSSWKINFSNLSSAILTGEATEVTHPSISSDGTDISSYNVTFALPGDSVSYTFDVLNTGTFDAVLSSVNIPVPVCTGNGDNALNDASNVCNHLVYSLTYSDDSVINEGDTLDKDTSRSLKLTLTYKDDITANELPNDDVFVSNLGISMYYSQA